MANQIQHQDIELVGVSTNNLKDISVRFPLHQLTVVTGVSGSGKSSLVFDTLYAEAYRRYVESLSSFARQYLKALPKPKIRSVKNLPPAIAVRQTRSGATNRSTVGTLTEMHDSLRVIFANIAEIHCKSCRRIVEKMNPDKVSRQVGEAFANKQVMILAPLALWDSVSEKELKTLLMGQGFTRLWNGSEIVRIEEQNKISKDSSWILVDRVLVSNEHLKRVTEACSLAFRLGRGEMGLMIDGSNIATFSNRLRCCGIDYIEPSMALFSFNHPLGACLSCQGFGSVAQVDEEKVIPDKTLSLSQKGVAPWNFGEHTVCYDEAYQGLSYLKMSVSLKKKPFSQYTKEEWQWLWNGDGKKYTGIKGYFAWLDTKRYKPHYRIHAARYRKYIVCPDCEGQRLNHKALACRVLGVNLAEASHLNVKQLSGWVDELELAHSRTKTNSLSSVRAEGASEAIFEAKQRLSYLKKMGLSYLSMDRSAVSLSGGELQRINMSRCLGSVLTETLFCLDEPSAGLHARDSQNLLEVIRDLKNMGNTVVVVEHEKAIIEGSDHFVEIGPQAGHLGGYVVRSGKSTNAAREKERVLRRSHDTQKFEFMTVKNAQVHNLKNISVRFAVGKINTVCGVSGSGKTSLVKHTLSPLLEQIFLPESKSEMSLETPTKKAIGSIGPEAQIKRHAGVMFVSQVSLGRSSRSTIGTYLGLMDDIRKIFAGSDEAKRLKLGPGSFSFNVVGGRCETCRGLGTVVEDLSFLGDMEILCPACGGLRFQEKVLSVQIRGKNLNDVLALTVDQAREFFAEKPSMRTALDAVINVGMGYVTLGQHTSSFSGGEAQRLKLVEIMRDAKKSRPNILIFDEPTTGLSDYDVQRLIDQFKLLTQMGHTVIIVEHHLQVLKQSDWLIEIGPEASELGGELVFEGTPGDMNQAKRSVTKNFLN